MPDFALKCDPADLVEFAYRPTEADVTVTLRLTNPTDKRQAFKIDCSSDYLFRARPVVGFVSKGKTVAVTLTAICLKDSVAPDADRQFFVVHHIAAAADKTTKARDVWAAHKGESDGIKKLYIRFLAEDDPKPTDEKKPEADQREAAPEKKEG